MATFDPLPDNDRAEIAVKIGEWIATTPKFAAKRQGTLELGESFQVWMLGLDQIAQMDRPFETRVKNTERWHHQIRIDAKTEAFARTIKRDKPAPGWKMMRLSASRLAQHIDNAINWLDDNAPEDSLVRLLEIPAYHAETFWLQTNDGENFLLLVHMPQAYEDFLYKHLYSAAAFLGTLSQNPPIEGAIIS